MSEPPQPNQTFASIVGQGALVKRICEFAALYLESGNPPGHILLTGIDGIGKRTLAYAFAAQLQSKVVQADARDLTRTGDLVGVLTDLGEGYVLLIEDVAALPKPVLAPLIQAVRALEFDFVVDKGMFAKTIHVPLKRFTFLATAQTKGECPPELIEVFPLIIGLQSYSHEELVSLCMRIAEQRGITITPVAAAMVIAGASVGTPHHIAVLIERLVGFGKTVITEDDVTRVSPILGLRTWPKGLDSPDDMENLSGIEFENVIASLLQQMGFQTEMTAATGDGGIDIVATLDRPLIGGRYLVQCKRLSSNNLVGASTVRDFYGALTADRSAVKGILVTTSGFTSQALDFARQLPIELIDGQQLQELLSKHGMSAISRKTPPKLFD